MEINTNYNTSYQTPFQLPIWSEWTVNVKVNTKSSCLKCSLCTASLKELAIQALFSHLKEKNILHLLPIVLKDNELPPILYMDVACQLFTQKQWNVLKSLISYWPYETFQLSHIVHFNCHSCWLSYVESEDVEDPEREGGDTERQLLRHVFKNILDGYFCAVKKTLENCDSKSPLRVLDLSLDPSRQVRGFMWEDEFRRLGRRIIKTLDVCVLAGLHKQARKHFLKENKSEENGTVWGSVDYFCPDTDVASANQSRVGEAFEISTWSDHRSSENQMSDSLNWSSVTQNTGEPARRVQKTAVPEIGVWNGNSIDLSHLTEIPSFNIIIDASISEKSVDILSWIRQRYDDFLPATSPLQIQIRFLDVSLHEERKFDSLVSRLPNHIHGLKLAEICEKRSAQALANFLPRFHSIRFLDLGNCAFDVTESPETVDHMTEALSGLLHLDRLSLAHNCITDCLSTLLSGLSRGLQFLDLSSCLLSEEDLNFLADSVHIQSLRSLSLASNELSFKWDSVLNLTDKLSSNMRILDLNSNEFVESQLVTLTRMTLSSTFSSLALLDLSWHEIRLSTLLNLVEFLSSQTALRTFCLSTPVDMADAGYSEPDSSQVFIDFMTRFAAKHRQQRIPLQLHWCLM